MNVKSAAQILPSQSNDRIQNLDILRGFALFGVILVNIFYFNVPDSYFNMYYGQFNDPVNSIVFHGLNWFFIGRFYPIFSFLFGLGFSIQFMKSLQKGVNPYAFLARRLAILLAFGLVHIIFVWEEDILFIYALFGFALLAFAGRSPKFILNAAVVLYLVHIGSNVADHLSHTAAQIPVTSGWFNELTHFYTTATYGQILQYRIAIYLQKFSHLDVLTSEVDRLAFFMLGFYAGRRNFIATFTQNSRFWFRVMLIFLCIFGIGFLVDKIWLVDLEKSGTPVFLLFLEGIVVDVSNFCQIFWYMIGFLLLLAIPPVHRFLAPLANLGRTALTVYVLHTIIFSLLFYSFGFHLYGSLIPIQLFVIAVSLFGVFVFLSFLWLTYFHYGPLEWVWRTLTYGKVLPFRKQRSV